MHAEFDLQPVLSGPNVRIRPIRTDEFEALYAVASDPLMWAQHPAKDRAQRGVFEKWFKAAVPQRALTIEEAATHRVIGSSRYYDWNLAAREVAIGFTAMEKIGGVYSHTTMIGIAGEAPREYAFYRIDAP